MRIGLISDIHSNQPALESVLAALGDVDLLLCAGDIVGYYADPNEVCNRLRGLEAIIVRGNHDAYVLGALVPAAEHRAASRTDWTRETLSPANRAWLAALPTEHRLEIDGLQICLRHASPWDEETYLYPDSPQLSEIELDDQDILVLGHTHHPMIHRATSGLIVNPGSVGQPRDRNPSPAYAILDSISHEVSFRRSEYDVASLQERLIGQRWSGAMVDILSRQTTGQ